MLTFLVIQIEYQNLSIIFHVRMHVKGIIKTLYEI